MLIRKASSRPLRRIRFSKHTARYVCEQLEERCLLTGIPPELSSFPAAAKTIYLDFVGAAPFSWDDGIGNTYLIHGPAGNNDPVPAFDTDGDPTTFSSSEATAMKNIWSIVAEKYSPFFVNVTTVNPGNPTIRVVIGGSDSDWLQLGKGGIAHIGGYGGPDNSCFDFSADVVGKGFFTTFVGETAAHEAGHELGLFHERTPGAPGAKLNEYYPGDGSQVPIMGGSNLNAPPARSIWWKTNVYPGQNSPDDIQDELDVLAGEHGSLSYRPDDFTDSTPGSINFDANGAVNNQRGIIEHDSDTDPFVFTAAVNRVSFDITNNSIGAMLLPNARIYRKDTGAQIPASVSFIGSRVHVSATQLVSGQQYVLEVSGRGGYGDIGQYFISGRLQTPASFNALTHVLSIGGVDGDNNIEISVIHAVNGSSIEVSDTFAGGSFVQDFPWSGVGFIDVFLGNGNNTIRIHSLADVSGGPSPTAAVVTAGNSSLILTETFSNDALGDFQVNSDNQITFAGTIVQYSGVQRVELHGASGFIQPTNNNFFVHSWSPTAPRLYVYGSGAYHDTLNIDADVADTAGSLITFNGATKDGGAETGVATLVIDDSTNAGGLIDGAGEDVHYVPKNFSIESQSLFSNATGGFREFDFHNLANLTIKLGRGVPLGPGPTVSVDSEDATTSVFVYGNPNDISFDTFSVGFTDPHGFPESSEPFTDAVLGNVWFFGNAGSNTLTIDDRDRQAAAVYTLTGSSIHSNSGGGTVHWDGVNFPDIQFYAANAGSTLTANGLDTTVPIHLHGGTGLDTLTVDDRNMPNPARKPTQFDLYSDKITRFFANSPTFETFSYDGFDAANLFMNDAETNQNIYATPMLPSGQQFNLNCGSGADNTIVYPRDAAGNPTILGNIGIHGGAGSDGLTISDTLAATGASWTMFNPFGAAAQDVTVGSGGLIGAAADVETIAMNGSSGDDIFNIDSYKDGTTLFVNAGAGNDTANFGKGNLAANITSIAGFQFDGQSGNDTFNLLSTGDLSGTYTRSNFSASVGITSYVNQLQTYNIGLFDSGTELVQIYPATNGPAVNVNSVLAGTTTAVHFNSPASPGVLRLGAASNTLESIKGAVIFDGGGGGSSISVSDSADPTGRVAHLTQTTLGAYPGDTLFPAGGSLTFNHIVAGFTPALTLNLGNGADTIYAQPNPTGTQTITGGGPTSAPGDTLNLALANAQNFVLHGTAASGNVTSTNLKTLTYSGFENGPTVDSVAPLVVNADININGVPAGAAPVAGAANAPLPGNRQSIDVSFSEDVAVLLGAGAIQLQNVTTGQIVPPSSIAFTYDAAAQTAHFAFPAYPNGVLPDGNYHGVILGGAIGDHFGNALSGDAPFDFFVLAGDANHDRTVDFSDLVVVAQHYGTSGKLFSEGDFDYDSAVGFSDLVTVAQKYGTTLAPPAQAAVPAPPLTTSVTSKKPIKSVFSVTPIVNRVLQLRSKKAR